MSHAEFQTWKNVTSKPVEQRYAVLMTKKHEKFKSKQVLAQFSRKKKDMEEIN